MRTFVSDKQKKLFSTLESCGELVFACGSRGAVANLVGVFKVRKNDHGDDQLDVGDGACHVHIDWARMKRVALGEFHGEGVLSFYDGEECLFKLYRMAGPFSSEIEGLLGDLI